MITKEQADHLKALADEMAVSAGEQAMAHLEFQMGEGTARAFVEEFFKTRAVARKLNAALAAVTETP